MSSAPALRLSILSSSFGSAYRARRAARQQDPVPSETSIAEPSAEEVREELERIIESPAFETSQRNRRFLRYVVEETLAGRAERIKAYSIATTVFERSPDVDPQTDPIIRIEASRLRRALDHYYLGPGRENPIRLVIRKGSYVPRFEHAAGSSEPRGPSI